MIEQNKIFGEFVRSSAFNLALSQNQIQYLLDAYTVDGKRRLGGHKHTFAALYSKGLVWSDNKGTVVLTRAGVLICELLVIAGYMDISADFIKLKKGEMEDAL